MRKYLLVFVFVFLAIALLGCTQEAEFDFENGQLIVGLEADYAPYNWLETQKSDTNVPLDGLNAYAEGYDVQIAKRLAESLELELVLKKIEWKGLIPALKSGMIDIIIAGMSPTEERQKSIAFTNEYFRTDHVIIVSENGDFSDANDFLDFAGAKIIGQKNTVYDLLASQLATKAGGVYQTPLESFPTIVTSIKTGVSDAAIVERPVAISVVRHNPSLKFIVPESEFELEEVDKIISIGVRKGDEELRIRLNEALENISVAERNRIMDSFAELAPSED